MRIAQKRHTYQGDSSSVAPNRMGSAVVDFLQSLPGSFIPLLTAGAAVRLSLLP